MTDADQVRAWFERGQHHYTPLIMSAMENADNDSYSAVVVEMGEEGMCGSTVLCWVMILAAVGVDADGLPRFLDEVPDVDRDLVGRHAVALMEMARSAGGDAHEVMERWWQTSEALGDDQIWYLIGVLAQVVRPVLTMLGGMETFGATSELVGAVWPQHVPLVSQPSMAASVAAVASGHPVDGLSILDRIVAATTVQDRLDITLAVSSAIFADTWVAGVATLDENGSLAGVSTLDERSPVGNVLAAGIAKAFGTRDPAMFDSIKPAIAALPDAELNRMIRTLILTSGVHLGQRFAEQT